MSTEQVPKQSSETTTSANKTVRAVDLFCGAGGLSAGIAQACRDLGYDLELTAINHWDQAISTHEQNHPDADQHHAKVEELHPPNVIDGDVDILVGGPECTHFSSARGGKPVKEQKRASPWHIVDWLEKLEVERFVIENVSELESWGPVEDGQPTRNGEVFDAWIDALHAIGYSVDWTVLNAADFGDPTSRERLFIVGQRGRRATFPEPTHRKNGAKEGTEPWRTAAEIIDWSDPGESIWTRDLTNKRVHSPPKDSTMQRIAEGLRRHCSEPISQFADVLDQLGRDEIRTLRQERTVPVEYVDVAAEALDEPFLVAMPDGHAELSMPSLVKYYGTSPPQPVDEPLDTVTANGLKYALSTPEALLLRQQDGAHPLDIDQDPVPTIATRGGHALVTLQGQPLIKPKNFPQRGIHSNPLYKPGERPHHTITADPRSKLVHPSLIRFSHGGATLDLDEPMPTIATERGGVFALSNPYLCPLYNGREDQRPRTRAVDRPLMTVPASKSPAAVTTSLVEPFIDDYEAPAASLEDPIGTITSRDRFALCVPELGAWGLDVRYRMLQPDELKQAQGFPKDFEITGTKSDQTEQIGNAVPVNLATSLVKHLLTDDVPSLATFVEKDNPAGADD